MFGGRISEVGSVVETGSRLTVEAPVAAELLSVGGSISIDGACLSAVDVAKDTGRFSVDLSSETQTRTTIPNLTIGAGVNVDVPLCVGDRLDGHLAQGHVDAIGKVTKVDEEPGGSRRVWIRPPKRFVEEIVAKGSVAVNGVSLTVAEVFPDRFSVALIPITLRDTTLSALEPDTRVNLESDYFVKTAGDLHASARALGSRSLAALPWAGNLKGRDGVEKCASQLAAGGGVLIYDPERENEADVVFAGATLRPESMVFLLTQVCGHTTVPCDAQRLERLKIPVMPGAGDRHGTAYHVSIDLAAGHGTGVSAHDRAATIRRLANPEATADDFLRPGHVFPLCGRPGGLAERAGHTEAALALCAAAGVETVAAICEVMGPDGTMLSGAAVERFALAWSLPMISIAELQDHM